MQSQITWDGWGLVTEKRKTGEKISVTGEEFIMYESL